jgi:hypothetical protein
MHQFIINPKQEKSMKRMTMIVAVIALLFATVGCKKNSNGNLHTGIAVRLTWDGITKVLQGSANLQQAGSSDYVVFAPNGGEEFMLPLNNAVILINEDNNSIIADLGNMTAEVETQDGSIVPQGIPFTVTGNHPSRNYLIFRVRNADNSVAEEHYVQVLVPAVGEMLRQIAAYNPRTGQICVAGQVMEMTSSDTIMLVSRIAIGERFASRWEVVTGSVTGGGAGVSGYTSSGTATVGDDATSIRVTTGNGLYQGITISRNWASGAVTQLNPLSLNVAPTSTPAPGNNVSAVGTWSSGQVTTITFTVTGVVNDTVVSGTITGTEFGNLNFNRSVNGGSFSVSFWEPSSGQTFGVVMQGAFNPSQFSVTTN